MLKKKKYQFGWGCSSVVACLLSMYKIFGLICSTTTTKKTMLNERYKIPKLLDENNDFLDIDPKHK
jgi:hypothetical protein